MLKAYKDAKERSDKAFASYKKYHDYKVTPHKGLKVGSFVMVRDEATSNAPGAGKKLRYKWTGPYRVLEIKENNNVIIKHIYNSRKKNIVHVDRIKVIELRGNNPFPNVQSDV